ncbi:MAG: HDOD domain-containing protein [Betaproteobacteria bacterium]
MLAKPSLTRSARFQTLRTLGKGGQGEVYLAEDTQLKRQVAIKTMSMEGVAPNERGDRAKALIDEALIVGQLSHPNIVTLYDAWIDGETPSLVFEYVEGQTLSAVIRAAQKLPTLQAADIAIQVLKAIGFAHSKGVVHRDIKPANVMIAGGETARVMDFGIAQLLRAKPSPDAPFVGTPAYMAPEYVAGQPSTERSDVFAVGMLLYEMLTGKPAVEGRDPYEVMYKIANEAFVAPSKRNSEIDERLDDLILKALAKDPQGRFETAAAMEDALLRYLSPEPSEAAGGTGGTKATQGTLEFLLRRMRYKSDFPALSSTMSAVNKSATSDTERVTHLSNAILKDFALTNKLLKLVNSASYSQYGGSISTVSRAVVIMGFDNIRNVAITLMLFEHLQNKAQASQLKDEILASYFSALLARTLASKVSVRDTEEAFICSMFHKLGRLLTAFYFHEEFQEIQKRSQQLEIGQEQAAAQVLGITFEELGVGVARSWHFPDNLIESLRRVADDAPRKPRNTQDRLRMLAELATGVTDSIRLPSAADRRSRMAQLAARFGDGLGVTEPQLAAATKTAASDLTQDTSLLNFNPTQSVLFCALRDYAQNRTERSVAVTDGDELQQMMSQATLQTAVSHQMPNSGVTSEDRQASLTAGIQDITNTLVGEYQLNDLLRMILETMYRGMGFSRVILCIRDASQNSLRGRFGFGQDVDQIIKRGFNVPLSPTRDAFFAAVSQNADIFIEDINADKIRDHIPAWYRKLVPARSLVLFPVSINKKPVGLFYADCDTQGAIRMESSELNLLKTLRNQAVLAIKSHS